MNIHKVFVFSGTIKVMNTKGTIVLASDHAGFAMKEEIFSFLKMQGYEVIDHGAFKFDEEDDYPDFIKMAARDVSRHPDILKGVVFGGSGTGEAIVCNRFPSVRAAVYYGGSPDIIQLSREHNNANMLSIGARFVSLEEIKMIVSTWLATAFSEDDRHVRRLDKIDNLYEDL